MNKIEIGNPFIETNDTYSRLCVEIKRTGKKNFKLFYEAEKKYEEFWSSELIDPFLVAIIPYAMENGYDIYSDFNVSEDEYYNLKNNFIPVCSTFLPFFNEIELHFSHIVKPLQKKGNAIGTGVSCGVDSLYTVLHHISEDLPQAYKLTHLVIMNAGSCSWVGGEESYKWFSSERDVARKVCSELNLELVSIHTNLMEFYETTHAHSGTMRMAGCVLSLSKLFCKYYLASGYPMNQFGFADDDARYAFFSLNCVSNDCLHFYLTGNNDNRDERVKYIADSLIAQKYLNVCWNGFHNCGRCEKCLRTIGSLYSIDKLKYFGSVFDLEDFNSNKSQRIGMMIYNSHKHPELYGFLKLIDKTQPTLYKKSLLKEVFLIAPFERLKRMLKKILGEEIYDKLRHRHQKKNDKSC